MDCGYIDFKRLFVVTLSATFFDEPISSIELGKVSIGIEVANGVASALGMKLSELVRTAE